MKQQLMKASFLLCGSIADGRSMWFTTSTISDWWMGDNKGQLLRHGSVVVERLFLFDVKYSRRR